MKQKLKIIVIGAGNRGMGYSATAKKMPEDYEIVAVAEPSDSRRNFMKETYGIPEDRCFSDWRPLLALGKIADAAFICLMDRDHSEAAIAAIHLGYHLLLEKPIAPTPEECVAVTRAAEEKGVAVLICHVLRFAPFFVKLKELILSGAIGEVQAVSLTENVGLVHQSHSFVRGNWGNSTRSSTMLLQKSCHDMDILQWLIDKPCLKAQSFGYLDYFTEKNAPEGAPERCADGCPHAERCPFNAQKLYTNSKSEWFRGAATKIVGPTDEEVAKALAENNYGRCVYRCDNDVVDRQTVNLEFADHTLVTFNMNAFNGGFGGREIRVMGSKGELLGNSGEQEVTLVTFETGNTEQIPVLGSGDSSILGGHGGGDYGIMNAFAALVRGEYDGVAAAPVRVSCENHMIAFAAEESRLHGGCVVDVQEFAARYGI